MKDYQLSLRNHERVILYQITFSIIYCLLFLNSPGFNQKEKFQNKYSVIIEKTENLGLKKINLTFFPL